MANATSKAGSETARSGSGKPAGAKQSPGDLLETYRTKRDFAVTREPSGADADTAGPHPDAERRPALAFCVQKHDATRLHYDFRIEWDGVLKSWAVTRGPSLDPADKRLAVRTEDHPLAYGDFEGTIPQKQYGGGTVMLWDRGTWEPREDPDAGFEKGSLKMRVFGEKMKGEWALVRMKPRNGEKRENWLLIKEKDDEVDRRRNLLKADRSVKTGRTMAAIAKGGDSLDETAKNGTPAARKKAENQSHAATEAAREQFADGGSARTKSKAPARSRNAGNSPKAATKRPKASGRSVGTLPAFVSPQLATLVGEAPEGEGWLSEMKYDGYRVLIAVGGGKAKLFTRNEKDWTEKFTGIADAALDLGCDSALIDGEVVAFDDSGRTDFSTLQAALKSGAPLACFCFDLLSLDGKDMRKRPLVERKAALRDLLPENAQAKLLYSEHVDGNGAAVLKNLCAKGHEGIVAKRADAPYRSGRTKGWLKVKCSRRQEFVVGGFSPSDKAGRPFSSILVGVFDGDEFVYRGRVGSGFTEATLDAMAEDFAAIGRKTSPFAELPSDIVRGAKFVTPKRVAEIEFAELTADGHIRHGVFKGLREDKSAKDVTGETPLPAGTTAAAPEADTTPKASKAPKGSSAARSADAKRKATTAKRSGDDKSTGKPAKPRDAATIAGIRVTHPDRIVFTEHHVTKGELALYYEAVAERMLAHAGDRPLSLVRCPEGPTKHCFFQKHASGGFPGAVGSVTVPEKDGGSAEYLTVSDAAGLVGAVQMNALEFHIWGARNDRLEKPDRLVIDLDPDEGLGFKDVKRAAFDLKRRLADIGLQTFALVTGGKGIHVVAPLARRQDWDDVKGFARAFAARQAEAEPKRFVATMSKAKRKGRIFIDWLRNERGSTAIAPYSTRSRPGAPVATPVTWDELEGLDAANGFYPETVLQRLDEDDPWADYAEVRQSITKAMLAAVDAEG